MTDRSGIFTSLI